MKLRSRLPLALILLTAFFAPIFGGYLPNDQTQFDGSYLGLFLTLMDGSGSNAPLLVHALIALPLLGALGWSLWTRRIQQVSHQYLTAGIAVLVGTLALSILFSDYKALSASVFVEWLACSIGFFAVVAVAGRRLGPLAIMTAIAAGGGIVALKAIAEYGQHRSYDPNYRVFAGWVNPNATAAVLLIGFFCLLALALVRSRLEALIATLAAGFVAFAILLTGSKGAISLGIPVGTLAFAVALVRPRGPALFGATLTAAFAGLFSAYCFLKNTAFLGVAVSIGVAVAIVVLLGERDRRATQAARLVSAFALAAVLGIALTFTTPKVGVGPSTSVVERSSTAQQTEVQSVDFRLNLWKSAFALIRQRPLVGYGVGSYRYESTRAGLSTATVLTHNVYLQLWAEAGVLALIAFLAIVVVWLWLVLRNRRHQPASQVALSAGVVAATASLLVHSLVDSDLYYFGLGVLFFMLIGTGILLSADSVAPEYTPKPFRRTATLGLMGLAGLLLFFAHVDDLKSEFRDARARGDLGAMRDLAESLSTIASYDGEAVYLTAWVKPPTEVEPTLRRSLELSPTSKTARALADVQLRSGELASAKTTLQRSLARDPDNLSTLALLITVQQTAGEPQAAIATARRMVAIEQTPYFQVRSIAENVPTETYLARFNVLAPATQDPRARADLYRDGVKGMLDYAKTTARIIKAESQGHPDVSVLGFGTWQEAQRKLQLSLDAARQASRLYRTLGVPAEAAEMDDAAATFAAALA